MPFITQINGATIDLEADTPVVTLPQTGVLNSFGASREIEGYNVRDDGSTTTTAPGEAVAPIVADEPLQGTYQGGVEFSNAALTIGSPLIVSVQVRVNPISGSYFVDSSGNVFIITENPLDAANLTASATITRPGIPNPVVTELVNAPLTEVVSNPLISTLFPNGVNGIVNNVITTQDPDPDAVLVVDEDDIVGFVCFAKGTTILTSHGYIPVEDLRIGDMVTTKDSGDVAITWIGSRKLSASMLTAFPNLRPVRITSGALGRGLPAYDLLVSPQHRILIRSKIAERVSGSSEVLVAAKQLLQVDGIDIAKDLNTVEYYHFMLGQHEVVTANGAETESLFTGKQALKSVGQAARAEILALLPQLAEPGYQPRGVRRLLSGRLGRKIVSRHLQNKRPLVAKI